MLTELKYAFRSLRHAPWFSALVALTLALGIGATTAITSVVNTVLLSPLPYRDAGRLVTIFQQAPGSGVAEDSMSPSQFHDILEQSTAFEELGMMVTSPIMLNREAAAEHTSVLWTSSSVLPMLGARPHLGRLFTEDDDRAGSPFVLILSYELWMRRYGADPDIVGKTIGLEDGFELAVVGVLEPGFLLDTVGFLGKGRAGNHELVTSIPLSEAQRVDRDRELYRILGKLRDNVSVAEAQAELDVIARRMLEEHPPLIAGESFTIRVVSLLDHVVGSVRAGLYWLLAAASFLLLIANMNVANLMLARGKKRRKELAICAALGAERPRLVGRLLLESVLLATLGASAGLLLTWSSLELVRTIAPAGLPRLHSISVDQKTLVAAVVFALLTTLLSGVFPALRMARVDPKEALSGMSRQVGVLRKRIDVPSIFVIVQVALAFVLLVGAGLITRSFQSLLAIDPGFDANGTLTLFFQERRDVDRPAEAMFDVVRALPGVRVVGAGGPFPYTPGDAWAPVDVEGYETAPDESAAIADRRAISPDYFAAMRIPLIAGRPFELRDYEPDAPPVRIVDRVFAKKFWPGEDPIGKSVSQNYDRGGASSELPPATVVGLVEHVRHYALETDGRMTLYRPATDYDRTFLVVRTDGDPERLARPVVDAIRDLDPDIAVSDVRTMAGRLEDHRAARRLTLGLVHGFGWIALTLAAVGLFGLVAYGVADGTREIGMRMALGATERHILALVLRHGTVVAGIGVGVGAVIALAASRFVQSFLYGVGATDPSTYLAIGLLLSTVALVACWIPAQRASRFHPLDAMRLD